MLPRKPRVSLIIALIASMSAPLAACGASSNEEGGPARIALVLPLSGAFSRQATLVRQGAEMARDEINQQGGIRALSGRRVAVARSTA